jgi:hypothetical protein
MADDLPDAFEIAAALDKHPKLREKVRELLALPEPERGLVVGTTLLEPGKYNRVKMDTFTGSDVQPDELHPYVLFLDDRDLLEGTPPTDRPPRLSDFNVSHGIIRVAVGVVYGDHVLKGPGVAHAD